MFRSKHGQLKNVKIVFQKKSRKISIFRGYDSVTKLFIYLFFFNTWKEI